MSLRLRVFIIIAAAELLIMMSRMVKRKKIELRDALVWFIMCIIVIFLDAFPEVLSGLASLLGIEVPANMVFMFAILLFIITIFTLTTTISRLSLTVRKLSQEIALLKKESMKCAERGDEK